MKVHTDAEETIARPDVWSGVAVTLTIMMQHEISHVAASSFTLGSHACEQFVQ